jgi:CheY-like chemotaxis protein
MAKTDLKKILVVDDDPSDRILLRKMLDNKYIVTEATNGKEALNSVCNEKPDLILMDIMMPKIDGYSACSMIKRDPSTADIPIIMLTGVNEELNVRLAEEIGASGYITKPPNKQDLLDKINQLLCSDT